MPHTPNSFISEEQQAELLAEIMGLESVESLGLKSATDRQAVTTRDAVAMVRNTEVKRCFNQVWKRVKKQMKVVKQRIWISRTKYRQQQVALSFTTFSCLKEKLGSSVATKLWERKCFTLELYHINGQVRTKAEAIQQWLHDGYVLIRPVLGLLQPGKPQAVSTA